MKRIIFLTLILFCAMSVVRSQNPLNNPVEAIEVRYSHKQPIVNYTLHVDLRDLSSYRIEMRIRQAQDTFRVAMVAHPEYDDRFWRYVTNLTVEPNVTTIVREDSSVWRITGSGGEYTVRYKIQLPAKEAGQRAAWRPFLTPIGGLVGGPHSFMYVVGQTLVPSNITLTLPIDWSIATGLEPTSDPITFFAPSVHTLVDGPILVGRLKYWPFSVDQVPHRVVYWPSHSAVPFDSTRLISHIKSLVQQASSLFGRLPYREYSFLFQDDAYGALEHLNSVTIGLPSADLAKDVDQFIPEIAHEYFHTWNLMRIHPVEYGDVGYKPQALSKGLWWSEGLTMFYADLFMRRAGIPSPDSLRIAHIEYLIGRYYASPGNMKLSPEEVSVAEYGPAGMLGDYMASSHLQGEILGTLLDLIIRDATNGRKSMDDIMRRMMENFSGPTGFTSKDIKDVIARECGCSVNTFFEDHVYGNKSIDFNKYLSLAGLRLRLEWKDASDENGKRSADQQVYAYTGADHLIRVGITDPLGCWGRAGLHTGDILESVNNSRLTKRDDFWGHLRNLKIGDKVTVGIRRPGGPTKIKVTVSGYKEPIVQITEIKEVQQHQIDLRRKWMTGS